MAPALLGMAFECRQTCLLQALQVALAAARRLNDASCDAGVNDGGLRDPAELFDGRVEGFAHIARRLVIKRAVLGLDERQN
jgi:ABC-type thiamine transport system ATPase subunit